MLKTKENCKLLVLKVIAVACESLQVRRGSKLIDLETFGILENWLLKRGGCNQRFHYNFMQHCPFSAFPQVEMIQKSAEILR